MIANDLRSEPRVDARDVPARPRFTHTLHILDLGRAGARLLSSERLAPGRRYPICLGEEMVLLNVLVLRCSVAYLGQAGGGGQVVYEAGVLFLAPTDEVRRQLAQMLAHRGMRPASEIPVLRLAS